MARTFNTPINLSGLELLNAVAMYVSTEPTPKKGLLIFNTATNKFGVGNGTSFDYMVTSTLSTTDVQNIIKSMIVQGANITVAYDSTAKTLTFSVQADGAATSATLRTLGTGALQATAGNDARLSDTRTPTDGSVTNVKVSSTAGITLDKLAETTGLKILTAAERTKLANIAASATANQTDAYLLSRTNHTGTQTVATISDFNSAVQAKLDALVNGAPGTLDQLNELANAIGNDPNFAATLSTSLATKADKSALAAVATSGSYADLLNKPVTEYAASFGDGTATTFTFTHNFNTRDVRVEVYATAAPYDTVEFDVQRTSVNVVTVLSAVAPAAGAFRILISKVA
jgi:hypothetical protein